MYMSVMCVLYCPSEALANPGLCIVPQMNYHNFIHLYIKVRRRITSLNVQRCYMLTDPGLEHLAHMWPALETVNISFCNRFTAHGVSHFADAAKGGKNKLHTVFAKGCMKISQDGFKPLRDAGLKVVN